MPSALPVAIVVSSLRHCRKSYILPGLGGLQSPPRMNYWYYFWIANFILAGSAFAVITVIVLLRGLGDLRHMLANLRAEVQRPE